MRSTRARSTSESWSWGEAQPSRPAAPAAAPAAGRCRCRTSTSPPSSRRRARAAARVCVRQALQERRADRAQGGQGAAGLSHLLALRRARVGLPDGRRGGRGRPVDSVSLNFSKIQVEYKQQKADGSLGASIKAGWDVKRQQRASLSRPASRLRRRALPGPPVRADPPRPAGHARHPVRIEPPPPEALPGAGARLRRRAATSCRWRWPSPGASFVGIDAAEGAIARGRALVEALGLDERDARGGRDRGPRAAGGGFDYVIAHGVYSWVAPAVRDRLLELCRSALSEHGIAYVSYNVLPGGRLAGAAGHARVPHGRSRRPGGADRAGAGAATPPGRGLVGRA